MKKRANKQQLIERVAIVLFILTAPLLILDRYTALQINNTLVHFIVFYLAVTALPVALLVYAFGEKTLNGIFVILFSTLAICGLKAFLTWGGDWKTQTIIYRNVENPNKTIEFRMRGDRFAFGYKKQIVQREKVLPFVDLIYDVDTSKVDPSKWSKTNQIVNEIRLPGEYVDLPNP